MSTIKYYYKFIMHILFLNLFTKFDTNNVFFPNLPQFENIVVLELYHIYLFLLKKRQMKYFLFVISENSEKLILYISQSYEE